MPPRKPKQTDRLKVLGQVQTPLGFYVLSLLIIESTLAIVLAVPGFGPDYKWYGFLLMIVVFAVVVLIVTILTFVNPRNLLYVKKNIRHRKSSHRRCVIKSRTSFINGFSQKL